MARDVGFVSWPQEPSLAPASQSSSECLLLSQKKQEMWVMGRQICLLQAVVVIKVPPKCENGNSRVSSGSETWLRNPGQIRSPYLALAL